MAMIIIATLILGGLYGYSRARKLNGNRADQLQYTLAFALAFSVIGLLVTVAVDRMI